MPPRLYHIGFCSIATPTDDWIHNSDSSLARRCYVNQASDCGSSNAKRLKVKMRLNAEAEVGECTANGMTRSSQAICRRR
jgi:hypothetical protein